MFDDRRKKGRRLAHLSGVLRIGDDVDGAVTTDISASGAFVATRLKPALGDVATVTQGGLIPFVLLCDFNVAP